jgi:hypothetical protein
VRAVLLVLCIGGIVWLAGAGLIVPVLGAAAVGAGLWVAARFMRGTAETL